MNFCVDVKNINEIKKINYNKVIVRKKCMQRHLDLF